MDVSSVGNGSAMTPEVQAQYAVKLIQMERASSEVVGDIILDTAEISKEAMDKCLSEMQ